MNRIVLVALCALPLAACGGPAPVAHQAEPETTGTPAPVATAISPDPAASGRLEAKYLGRWTGVEGMYLNVTRRDGGGVNLDMKWDLDNAGIFPGSVTAEGLRFTRRGDSLALVPTDGAATGLKYLAGKKDCLTVRPGEGYCRD